HLRGRARDVGRRDQRGVQGRVPARRAHGHPQVHRGPDRLDGCRQRPALVDLRQRADRGHRRDDGQDRHVVRQRVGLLQPLRRHRPEAAVRTLDDLDVEGRRVLLRVDFNVPLEDGRITDDARIRAALPTIEALRERGARLLLAAHLGRPKDREPELSLRPTADRLSELLGGVEVALAPDLDDVPDGDIVMLENVRYEKGETKNDPELAKRYAALADVYVNDAFGAAHRAHASTEGVAHLLPSAAGLLLQREVETLTGILSDPQRPLVAIVGGAKVTDKIGVLEAFLERADTILIGGAMCFPFFSAQGHGVGDSLCEAEGIDPARRVLDAGGDKLRLPTDLVAGRAFEADTDTREIDGVDVPDGWMGLDVGRGT